MNVRCPKSVNKKKTKKKTNAVIQIPSNLKREVAFAGRVLNRGRAKAKVLNLNIAVLLIFYFLLFSMQKCEANTLHTY